MTEEQKKSGPLAGVRIVDITSVISGPMAIGMLSDQGAEVIKIEPPTGDILRARGKTDGLTPSFMSCNRGKTGVSLDLKIDSAKDVLWKLIEEADVFAQNFRPGVAERLGFGPDEVLRRNPRIVYLSISGVGDTGPYVKKRVYDPVVQALSGLADMQADPLTGRPKMIRSVIADKTTAVYAAQAVAAALYSRSVTGKGQHVQVSMLDTMVNYNWVDSMSGVSVVGKEEDQTNVAHDMIFPTADGYVTIGAVSNKEWVGLCNALGRPDLIDHPKFATPSLREINRQERLEMVEEATSDQETAPLMARMEEHQVPCAPVLRRHEVMDDPQVIASGIVQVVDQSVLGPTRQARPAALFSETPCGALSSAPTLGQDTRQVLSGLGYSDEAIEALIASKAAH